MKQINNFWNWFLNNNHLLTDLKPINNEQCEAAQFWLSEFLGYYCPQLSYVILQKLKGKSETELIISANSNPDYYDEVITLVNAAPRIKGWKITAFIQPWPELLLEEDNELSQFIFPDMLLKSAAILFIPWDNDQNNKMILQIYCREFTMGCKKKHWKEAFRIFIQHFIGEVNFGNHIAFVQLARTYKETKQSIHLYDLPYYIDCINEERRHNTGGNFI